MMGRLSTDQGEFFYDFNLDDHVPGVHLLRCIDAVLDLGWLRGELRPHHSHTGRACLQQLQPVRGHRSDVGDGRCMVYARLVENSTIEVWKLFG